MRAVAVTLAIVIITWSASAGAETVSAAQRDEARALVYQGREQRTKGAIEDALASFARAHAIMGVPTTGLELAKTQIAAGRLLEARATLSPLAEARSSAREAAAFVRARTEARELLAEVGRRLPTVTVLTPSLDTRVTIDGDVVSRDDLGTAIPLDPGLHEIVAEREGAERRRTVELVEGRAETVRLVFAPALPAPPLPAPEPPPPAKRTNPLVYVGGAILAAGAVTGSITGGMTLHARSTVEGRCAAGCPQGIEGDVDRGKTLGTVSTVAFAAAGAGVALLVYGLLFPSEPVPSTVGLGAASVTF